VTRSIFQRGGIHDACTIGGMKILAAQIIEKSKPPAIAGSVASALDTEIDRCRRLAWKRCLLRQAGKRARRR
jgi:hypothetical protein